LQCHSLKLTEMNSWPYSYIRTYSVDSYREKIEITKKIQLKERKTIRVTKITKFFRKGYSYFLNNTISDES